MRSYAVLLLARGTPVFLSSSAVHHKLLKAEAARLAPLQEEEPEKAKKEPEKAKNGDSPRIK